MSGIDDSSVAFTTGGLVAGEKLAAVGPIDPEFGYPRWYEDSTGIRLALGLDIDDALAPVELPNPGPVSPDNLPEEAFYFSVEATLTTGGAVSPGRARVVLALEATWGGTEEPLDGQQIVFGRIRVRLDGGRPGASYTFFHPYGTTDPLEADERGRVFVTSDIGVTPGQFSDALASGVAPFLRWPSGAPEGYLGNPDVPHVITGSPLGQNVFRVEGPGVATGAVGDETLQTDLFSVQGKIATVIGAEVTRAVIPSPGNVDVFATSAPLQDLVVGGPGVPVTPMRRTERDYVARVALGSIDPAAVVVRNRTDDPPTEARPARLTDVVTLTSATYDVGGGKLTVAASSSASAAALTVAGVGPLTSASTTFDLGSAPAAIRVESDHGGHDECPVLLLGDPMSADPPLAAVVVRTEAGERLSVPPGETVQLDGSGSTGAVTWQWSASSGVLTDPEVQVATLVVPDGPDTVTVGLIVTAADGSVADMKVDVTVDTGPAGSAPGADRTVDVGDPVELDGAASTGASTFRWSALSGPDVVLSDPVAMRPTVTLSGGGAAVLRLTVSGPAGEDSADITLTGRAGTVTITGAQYRVDKREFRVRGTTTGPLPDRVEITTADGLLGEAVVDSTRSWSLDVGPVFGDRPPLAGTAVTVRSRRGGTDRAPLTVRD